MTERGSSKSPGMTAAAAREKIRGLADPARAADLRWFFKTGPGEYGEGDVFLGLTMPKVRNVAREFRKLPLPAIRSLLRSKYHEERSLALIVLVWQFERADEATQESLYRFYLDHLRWVNNWDLVDGSAGQIAGRWLMDRDKGVLDRLARSPSLWDRRVAIISTSYHIGKHRFEDALRISAMLLEDREDLIHKAVGWMLREIWKREAPLAEAFIEKHHRSMPRTMLRYAIEQFPEEKRRRFLLKSRRQLPG